MEKQLYTDYDTENIVPDGIGDSKLRICILMLNSPNIPKYAHHATMINYMYATKHGYDFIVERIPLNIKDEWCWDGNNEYKLVWYKAEFIKRHLKRYHYVLYIDSDAFVQNIDMKIEDIINNYNTQLLFQEDNWFSNNGITTNDINTGLCLAKNCEKTFEILDAWIRAPYVEDELFKYRNNHPREQYVIGWIREKYKLHDSIKVIHAKNAIFGQYDSEWIIHLGGVDRNSREMILEERYKHIIDVFYNGSVLKYKKYYPPSN